MCKNNVIFYSYLPARPVQMKWPRKPPTQTPLTSLIPAMTMVASWDLSPHSARKVMANVLLNTRKILTHFFPNQDFSLIWICYEFRLRPTNCYVSRKSDCDGGHQLRRIRMDLCPCRQRQTEPDLPKWLLERAAHVQSWPWLRNKGENEWIKTLWLCSYRIFIWGDS